MIDFALWIGVVRDVMIILAILAYAIFGPSEPR